MSTNFSRRDFLKTTAVAAAATAVSSLPALGAERKNIKLGLDNFAVRAFGWKADALIDFAVSLKTDSLFITDLDAFETHESAYLKKIRSRAADNGLQIHLGSWSICPTSVVFRKNWGTAEEHLGLGLRMAADLGSPVFRVVLGTMDDRKTPGGIQARIEDTVKVCKALRSRSQDLGVKIAVENHAGDMQARELVQLIEAAGKDYVGANLDSGNAVWTLEDPIQSMETLAPYALTTSLRDSAVWETEKGISVQWTAMGEGNFIDLKDYFNRFAKLCPGVPVHIETIGGFIREFPIYSADFWKQFPEMRAGDFAHFMDLARKGKSRPGFTPPAGVDRKTADQDFQKGEITRSIAYCKEALGLGLK